MAPSSEEVAWSERITALVAGPGPTMLFQPIHRLVDGVRVGWEALARFPSSLSEAELEALHGPAWRLNGYTSEGPALWFEMADALGFGVDLELSAVQAALERMCDVPPDEYLAVNVGPQSLVTGRFADAVEAHNLSRVVVELTEHLVIDDYQALRHAVVDVQERHSARTCTTAARVPGLAADDLGAGSASMHHLLALASVLDLAKLDVSLTRGIATDANRQDLAAVVVNIGRRSGFRVVAEGIEDAETMEVLRSIGVHAGQGWHLGRPGPLPPPAAVPVPEEEPCRT